MSIKKAYTAPIWALLIILVFSVAGVLLMPALFQYHLAPKKLLFIYWIFPPLLLGEALVYFLIRKDVQGRSWIWLHVGCMCAVGLSFFMHVFMSAVVHHSHLSLSGLSLVVKLYIYGRLVLFWGGLIPGQLVFIKVLIENFFQPRSAIPEEVHPQTPDVLDDLID